MTGTEMASTVVSTDMVNHPPHYNNHPSGVECIEVTRCMTFDGGNAFKYVYRSDYKNGAEDIEKTQWYLLDVIGTLQHVCVDPLFIPALTPTARVLINRIIAAEPDPVRRRFFRAMRDERLHKALAVARTLLGQPQ